MLCSSSCRSIRAAIPVRKSAKRATGWCRAAICCATRSGPSAATCAPCCATQARLNAIKSSESALEATQTGYEVGTRNIVDVLQAQQRLYASQFDLADSRYQYMIDLVQLKQTTGVIVPADLADLNSFADKNRTVRRIESVTLSRTPSLQ